MTAPAVFTVANGYWNPTQYQRDIAQLQQDTLWCYDQAWLGPDKWVANPKPYLQDWALNNKKVGNQEGCLVMSFKGQLFLESYLLLQGIEDVSEFPQWVANVFRPAARSIYNREDNWGAWGILGVVLSDLILGNNLSKHSYRFYEFLSKATDMDGVMKEEIKRTNSGIWYSYFALAPMYRVAQLLKSVEIYVLKAPLEWLWQYVENPQSWPYRPKKGIAGVIQNLIYPHAKELELPRKDDWPANLYWVAGQDFDRIDWQAWGDPPPYKGTNIYRHG